MSTVGPCRALDHGFVIEADQDDLIANLAAVYAPLATDSAPDTTYRIERHGPWIDGYQGDERIFHVDDLQVAEEHLIWTINRSAIGSWPGVLLHGGVVCAADGRGIVILGRSGAGKSTLVTALVQRGYGYLSDELVPFRPDGTVVAHPRSISLKPGSWSMVEPAIGTLVERRSGGGQLHVDPRTITADLPRSTSISVVVLLDAPPIASEKHVDRPRLAKVVAEMSEHAFDLANIGPSGLSTLRSVAAASAAVTMRGGTLAERVEVVEMMLDGGWDAP